MPRIVYVGLPSKLHGKHLMKILANLKDFGVGRMFLRGAATKRFSKPSFVVVSRVEPAMDPDTIWGNVYAHEYNQCIDRGVQIIRSEWPDYQLVAKEDEQMYFDMVIRNPPMKILPRELEPAPLLRMLLERDFKMRRAELPHDFKITRVAEKLDPRFYRQAEPGEEPNFGVRPKDSPLTVEELKRGINFDI